MNFLYKKEEIKRVEAQTSITDIEETRPLWQNTIFFASMIAVLVFANWSSGGADRSILDNIFNYKNGTCY